MKEIKFRFWDGKKLNYAEFNQEGLLFYKVDPNYDQQWNFLRGVIGLSQGMVFTGMKDKNGHDIYVGDIVSCGRYNSKDVVEYKNESAWLKYLDTPLHRYMHDLHLEVEVIGNYFENRELLSIRKKFYSITGEKYYLKLDFKEDLIKEIERIDPESVRRELLSIHKENCRSVAYFNASTKKVEFYSLRAKDQIQRKEHLILLDLLSDDQNPFLKHFPEFDLERIIEDVELLYQL